MPASIFAYYAGFTADLRGVHRDRHRRAPGMVRKPVHQCDRSFPAEGVRFRRRPGRDRRRHRRHVHDLLVGLIVQWTGNQQLVFVWAGIMHLISLALFWLWFRGRFTQVDVDAPLDTSRTHRGARDRWRARGGAAALALGAYVMNTLGLSSRRREDHRRAAAPRRSPAVSWSSALALFYASRPKAHACVTRQRELPASASLALRRAAKNGGAFRPPRRGRARFPAPR